MPTFQVTYNAACPKCGHHWKTTVRRDADDKIDAGAPTPPVQCEKCKAFTAPYRIIVGAAGEPTC